MLSATADGVELGLTVCYDVRFPELYRILAVRGARILTVPAAFTLPRRATTGRSSCAPARSRTSASSSPPTRSASTREGLRSGGRSMIVDPWGLVLAQAADSETVITADLDLDAPGRHPHAAARRWPTAAPRPTAGPTR